MLRRIPWFLRVSVMVAVVLAVSVTVFQSWSSGTPGTGGWTQTQWGPLGPADRDLLVKVRQAGLWEAPTGQQASQQASTQSVRDLGAFLATQHAQLDIDDRKVADQLGVLLPSAPSVLQQGWMAEISAATGSDYDRIFVQRLRQAHGIVLPVIAQVRSSTRNDLIRQFAEEANDYVARHMQHLEATGLVDYGQLPDPPSPGLLSGDRSFGDLIVPILIFVAALLAAIGLIVGLRRRTRRPVRVVAPLVTGPPPILGPPSAAIAAIPAPRTAETSGPHRIPTGLSPGLSPGGPLRAETTGSNRFPTITTATIATTTSAEDSGPHQFTPVNTTGSRHLHPRGGVETTGPRHSVRR